MRVSSGGLSIRAKLIAMVAGTLVLAIASAAFFIRGLVYQNIVDEKMQKAEILTASLVHDIKYDLAAEKPDTIPDVIAKYVTYYRTIRHLSFFDRDLVRVATSGSKPLGERTHDPEIIAAVTTATPLIKVTKSDEPTLAIRSIAPILQGSHIIGATVMDVSIDDIEETLSAIDQRIAVILIVTVAAASLLVLLLLRSTILLRLRNLMSVTRQIAAGNYDGEINDLRRDEIGSLAQAFDRMTADLRRSKAELDSYNQQLEQKVAEQTAKLQRTYEDLKNAQGQLVLREKMASLGALISGIAHEINTPVGAIHNVAKTLTGKIGALPQVLAEFRSLPAFEADRYADFLQAIIASSRTMEPVPYGDVNRIERFLEHHGIEAFRDRATALAKLKFNDMRQIEEYLGFVRDPILFSLAESLGSLAQATTISETSSQKISEIVRALKYYAYTEKGRFEPIQINESIQTALVLLRNRLKHGTTVTTDFAPELTKISCTSEIHQVWTNLLSNASDAIEAMGEGYHGEILVRTRQTADAVVVTVTDNGVGIPDVAVDRIFDPFFTTKDIGKGTGLGLSIVAGIVRKHGGAVGVTNRRQPTAFQITLPFVCEHQDAESGQVKYDETDAWDPRMCGPSPRT